MLLSISFILVSINGTIFWTIFRVFIYVIGGTFTQIALVSVIQNMFSVFLSPFWGSLGDELNKRKPFIVFGSAAIAFFTPLFIYAKSVTEYLVIFIFASLTTSMVNPNLNALISGIAEKEYRGRALGYFLGISAIGWTLGGILSGAIAEIVGMDYVFFTAGVIGIMGALLVLLFLKEEGESSKKLGDAAGRAWKNVIETFRIEGNPNLNTLLLAVILHGTGGGIFFTLFQIKFFESIGRSFILYGIVSGLSGIGSIIAPPLYGSLADKMGRKIVMQATLFIYSLYFVVLGLLWDPIILTILWFLPLWPGVRISSVALVADIAEEKEMGRYQGFLESSAAIARMLGALLGGIFADIFRARADIFVIDKILIFAAIGPLLSAIIISKLKV